jgi:cyclic pyranopterin monophosphate synthase
MSAKPGKRAASRRPKPLTHVDARGRARMVDVSAKAVTTRRAVARATVLLGEAFAAVRDSSIAKGDVLAVARLAGIMGAKETSRLVPLCHPLSLTSVRVETELDARRKALVITCEASTNAVTGVEMEAMTGAAVAALTAYDMVKGVTKAVVIERIELLEKSGGKSGDWRKGV